VGKDDVIFIEVLQADHFSGMFGSFSLCFFFSGQRFDESQISPSANGSALRLLRSS
jgi:hypothetical protein